MMISKNKIAPSLICMDFLEIGKQIHALNKMADLYHCDVIDGHFAPSFGLPLEYLSNLKKVATLPIDVHLMVEDVENITERLVQINVDMITLHIECIGSTAFRVIRRIKNAEIKVGIALNPVTPIEALNYIFPIADKITVLTFDPGLAGQKMVGVTLDKVARIASIKKDNAYSFDIEVDGSCNENNFLKMKKAGANQFVVGTSGLFSLDEDVEIAWAKMNGYMNNENICWK